VKSSRKNLFYSPGAGNDGSVAFLPDLDFPAVRSGAAQRDKLAIRPGPDGTLPLTFSIRILGATET
jgi:hypothetical protein